MLKKVVALFLPFGHWLRSHVLNFSLNHPRKTLASAIIISLILSLGLLKMETDFSVKVWFDPQDPLIQKLNQFEAQFGSDESVVLVVNYPQGIFRPEIITSLQEMTAKMWLMPDVVRVDSLTNYQITKVDGDDIKFQSFLEKNYHYSSIELEAKKQEALSHKIMPNFLINKLADTSLIYARLRPGFGKELDYQRSTLIARDLAKHYENTIPGMKIAISGAPTINYAFMEVTISDLKRFMPISILLISLILLYQFRTIWGVTLPMLVILLSILVALGIGGFLGIKFNNLVSALPGIMIAIGIAETVHILTSYFQGLKRGDDHFKAISSSLEKNIWPTFLTCFTTFLGFITGITSPLEPITDLALLAGIGTLYSWFLTLFMVVPLVVIFKVKAKPREEKELGHKRAKFLITWIEKHSWAIFIWMTALCIGSIIVGLKVQVDSDPFGYLSTRVKARQDNEFIKEKMGGIGGIELFVDSGKPDGVIEPEFLNKVDQLQKFIQTKPFVTRCMSILDIVKEIHQTMHGGKPEFYSIAHDSQTVSQELFMYALGLPEGMDLADRMSIDRSGIRMSILWTIHRSSLNLVAMHEIEAKMSELGLKGYVTGRMPLYKQMNGYVVDTFTSSMFWEMLMITFIMFFAFGSVRLGILSMVPNLAPLAFGGGVLWLMGHDFDIGASIVASVVLGIAVDDTIHFLAHWVHYRHEGHNTKDSLVEVFATSGPAILWTTLILCLGFGCFILGDFNPNVIFGILTATMLAIAFIFDLLYLPAILILLERYGFNIK